MTLRYPKTTPAWAARADCGSEKWDQNSCFRDTPSPLRRSGAASPPPVQFTKSRRRRTGGPRHGAVERRFPPGRNRRRGTSGTASGVLSHGRCRRPNTLRAGRPQHGGKLGARFRTLHILPEFYLTHPCGPWWPPIRPSISKSNWRAMSGGGGALSLPAWQPALFQYVRGLKEKIIQAVCLSEWSP